VEAKRECAQGREFGDTDQQIYCCGDGGLGVADALYIFPVDSEYFVRVVTA